MHHPDHNASPFNDIPPVVVMLVVLIGVIELAFQAGSAGLVGGQEAVGWRVTMMERFGFFDLVFELMRESRQTPIDGLMRFFTYVFVHFAAMHAIFACVMLLAIGKFVGERFSGISVLIIFFTSAAAGAIAFGLMADGRAMLIGAYPAIYGLLGAFTWTLFMSYERAGENRIKAFQLIGILMGLQLAFRLLGGVLGAGDAGPDWIADLTGFVVGFALSYVLAPDGPRRVADWVSRMRNR